MFLKKDNNFIIVSQVSKQHIQRIHLTHTMYLVSRKEKTHTQQHSPGRHNYQTYSSFKTLHKPAVIQVSGVGKFPPVYRAIPSLRREIRCCVWPLAVCWLLCNDRRQTCYKGKRLNREHHTARETQQTVPNVARTMQLYNAIQANYTGTHIVGFMTCWLCRGDSAVNEPIRRPQTDNMTRLKVSH